MVRFPEATKRRADPAKVLKGKVRCKKCGSFALRPIKKTKT